MKTRDSKMNWTMAGFCIAFLIVFYTSSRVALDAEK